LHVPNFNGVLNAVSGLRETVNKGGMATSALLTIFMPDPEGFGRDFAKFPRGDIVSNFGQKSLVKIFTSD